VSQHGFKHPLPDTLNGLQTFLGGLFLGYIYIRSRSVVPGSIFHVSTNAYIPRFIEILSG
jgi:membrane protease YdiL (CAAX protease family)